MSNDVPLRVLSAQSGSGFGTGSGSGSRSGARSGAGGTRPAAPRERGVQATAQAPRWAYWRLAKSAPPWKLAALSLDIEPASIDPADPGTFPDAAAFGRFNLVTEAVKRRFGDQEHRLVSLSDFVRWAHSISLELPPQLRSLGAPPPLRRRPSDAS